MSEKTMEETMAEAFDAAEARAVEPPVEAAPVEATETPAEAEPVADGPARGPDGKFISKTVEAPDAATPAANPAESAPTPAAAETPSAPASWTADERAHWATLPPATQAAILRRESEVSKGFEERASKLKAYEPVEQVLGPRRQQLVAAYGSEGAALQQLFQLSDFARDNPRGFMEWFARERGLDLGALAAPQEAVDPNDPLAAIKAELDQLKAHTQAQTQAQQNAQRAQLVQTVEQFKASGKAPHFEEVRQDMAKLATVEPNLTIEELYDRAVYLNPTTRARILADQQAAAQAEQEKARKAEEDRRIAETNVSTRGAVGGSPATPKSMEETMREVYDRKNAA